MTGKRKSFSLNDKRRLIEAYDKLPKMSQRVAATKLGIPQATLCSLLKRRQTVLAANNGDRKRIRSGKAPVVEAALVKWIDNAQSCNAPLSAPLVKEKAEELAAKLGEDNFKVSIGWFERFKKRENIVFKKLHGEAAEADMVSPGEWLEDQWRQMRQEYTEENIWNAAETGIYFRALPHSTFTFRSDNKRGGKKLKERITVLFACSATGVKKELFVIGKSHNPRCFNYVHTLPVRYAANAPAWMTRNLFVGWLKEWDRKLAQERRKILLLVDSSPAHDMTNTTLRNIRVEFLPKNATSFLQPCDQGIIRTAKAYFRKEMARTVLQKLDEEGPATAVDIVKKISLLDAVLMLRDAWADVGASTIRDCWRKVGLVMSLKEELETVDPPPEISAEEFEQWIAVDDSTPASEPVTDEDIIAAVREGFGMGTDSSDEEEEKVESVVPSRAEMRNAIRILKTGLPHVGFNNFDLLHHFAKEVNLVLDKTTIRICEMTYSHGTEPIHKTEKNMLDFIFSVDDPVTWHTMNLMQNRKHYSFLKYLGPKKISSIQNDHGAGVYYNTLVPADGRIIKYGIISTDTLIEDLLHWKTLYIAGRLHKPVKILLQNDNGKLRAALVANMKSAVTASFLMLPESFSEEDLFMQIAGLSYSGDFRMVLGEDKSKVFNIVRENMQNFQLLYSSILQECPQVVYKPQQGKLEVDKSPEGQFTQLMALPRILQQRITYLMDPPGKNHDVEEILLQVAQDPDCGTVVQQGISSIVKSPSITQSLKGIATAGLMKTVSYSAKKVQKMWKGWRRRT